MCLRTLLWLPCICLCVTLQAKALSDADTALIDGDYRAAIGILQERSNNGDATAAVRLASLYHRGEGVKRDIDRAVSLYLSAAELSHPEAQFQLAELHMQGRDVELDEAMAITFYRDAARSGHPLAEEKLRAIYADADLPIPDFNNPRGLAAIRSAQKLHTTPSVELLATTTQSSGSEDVAATAMPIAVIENIEPERPTTAIGPAPPVRPLNQTVAAISADEAKALRLAQEHGIDVQLAQTPESGPTTIATAAEPTAVEVAGGTGNDVFVERFEGAQRTIALENFKHGRKRLKQLSDEGYAPAALVLADMAERGKGMQVNAADAMTWRQRAAALGSAEAQYQLAELYMHGRAVEPDEAMAITYYRDAARGGHPLAQAKLRLIYTDAGVQMPDFARRRKPVPIYSPAPSASDPTFDNRSGRNIPIITPHAAAPYSLGDMYRSGTGVTRNSDAAVKSYHLAADQGHVDARADLASLNAADL